MNKLLEEFYRIRDIPYRIPLSVEEEDVCCSWKMKQLFSFCASHSIPCRYRVCEFLWSDLALPDEVTSIFHENLSTHVFLEIEVHGEWLCVDPTWDVGLSNILPVNERDSVSSTYFAVKPIRFYDLPTSHTIMTWESSDEEMIADLAVHKDFYRALNDWFAEVRK